MDALENKGILEKETAHLWDTNKVLVLDGAFATELEKHGCDLKDELWSAKVLIDSPQLIQQVHRDYLAAGADCIESSGYQATVQGFVQKGYTAAESEELMRKSVRLAVEVRDAFIAEADFQASGRKKPFVAASVGPYGAYLADGSEYRGHYGVTEAELVSFHEPRIALFGSEHPDIFACETIPCLEEAKALVTVLAKQAIPAWISFSCKDKVHTCGDDLLRDCAAFLETADCVSAIGINCTDPAYVAALIGEIRKGSAKPIVVYPNTGEKYDPVSKQWYGTAEAFDAYAKEWAAAGAAMIGGCCRTSPDNIQRIASWAHR